MREENASDNKIDQTRYVWMDVGDDEKEMQKEKNRTNRQHHQTKIGSAHARGERQWEKTPPQNILFTTQLLH